MFRKEISIKSQSQLKASTRKQLVSKILAIYPECSDLFSNKPPIRSAKLGIYGFTLYFIEDNPVFLECNNLFYPTVYLLWLFPDLLPRFVCEPAIFDRLKNGADLMVPGLVTVKSKTLSKQASNRILTGNHLVDNLISNGIHKDTPCSISLLGNRSPIAVGYTARSCEEMYEANLHGKAVVILHIYQDKLWELGDCSHPPDIPVDDLVPEPSDRDSLDNADGDHCHTDWFNNGTGVSEKGTNENENYLVNKLSDVNLPVGEADKDCTHDLMPAEEKNTDAEISDDSSDSAASPLEFLKDPEELLSYCFFCGLKRLKSPTFPMLTSDFYCNFISTSCPAEFDLNVKKTKWKKLSKFLCDMSQDGLISIQELKKGNEFITAVDFENKRLCDFRALHDLSQKPNDGATGGNVYQTPEINIDIFFVSQPLVPLLSVENPVRKGDALTGRFVRDTVTTYVRTHDLQCAENKKFVEPDALLRQALDLEDKPLAWDNLFKAVFKKMTSGYRIYYPNTDETFTFKGTFKPISLRVQQKASNKKVTLVSNLSGFRIDQAEFSRDIKKKAQCSVCVTEDHLNQEVVQVQGNQVAIIGDLLTEKYAVPKKWIHGLELAPKRRK